MHDEDNKDDKGINIDAERAKLREKLELELVRERRLLGKRKGLDSILAQKFPYRINQLPQRGNTAFIPSYHTYTEDDQTLLLAAARSNGGLLPVDLRMALLEGGYIPPRRNRPESLLLGPEETKTMRNWLKRRRKQFRR